MAEKNRNEFQTMSKQLSALQLKKITLTDAIDESAEVTATNTPRGTADDDEIVAHNETEQLDLIKFYEFMSSHDEKSRGEAYIDFVFENYGQVSPRSANYLDIIRNSFAQPRFRSHFENVVENSKSHYQTCDYIRSVVDDVLQDLHDSDFELQTPLTATEKDFLKATVTERVFEHHVNIHVAKIVQRAVKQIELETTSGSSRDTSIIAAELEASEMKMTAPLEKHILHTPFLETIDRRSEIPKIDVQGSIYVGLPRYLPAFRPHLEGCDYVTFPYLCNLPSYTKALFPACKGQSTTSWRTSKLGHSYNAIPSLHLSRSSTQIYSKLVKYYNSFK